MSSEVDPLAVKVLQEKIKLGPLQMKVQTDSMIPVLRVNQRIQVEPLPKILKRFDIIIFFEVDHWTCHFLWQSQLEFNGTLVTKSLKNPKQDDFPVPISQVLGVVRIQIPIWQKLRIQFLQIFS